MGEKVSEAPEPVPRSCSGHGSRTLVPPAAAVSSKGASSAESSSGSETLSEEGEPGRFSCRSQPPRPPGGALGTRLPAVWAPARVALERGVPALPLPPPGGAVLPPVPRVSSASQEEQDEEDLDNIYTLLIFPSRREGMEVGVQIRKTGEVIGRNHTCGPD
ncbi:microtubule-associated serine/threonine-protein kinase 4 [Cricetulus griseus]|nr:microtubule-associated serine/threonine-protein kinase 4 [Cricetulus griseus]